MNKMLKDLLRAEGDFVFEHEDQIMEKFVYVPYPELLSVYFNEETVKLYFWDTDTGQHYTDEISAVDYSNWKEEVLNVKKL